MPDADKTVYVPKQNCYSLGMAFKELPDPLKIVPLELEGAVNKLTSHFKTAYKAVKCDFYKDDGFGEEKDTIPCQEDNRKKQ